VLWFVNLLLPSAARALGDPEPVYGGWLDSLLKALNASEPNAEVCVVCEYGRPLDLSIGNVRYVTLPAKESLSKKSCKISRIVSEFRPDVVHIHGTEHYYASLPEAVFAGKPVLVSLQGIINGCTPHYNGGLAPFELRPFFHPLRGLLRRDNVYQVQEDWFRKRSVTEAQSIRARRFFSGRTDWDRAWVSAINPLAQYFHVDEVLRPEFYQATDAGCQVKRHSIYCGGAAVYPLKGLHGLLRAIRFVRDKYPDVQVRVANALNSLRRPVGFRGWLSDSQYRRFLRSQIKQCELAQQVVALPPLSAAECVRELQQAQVFVLPSLCENSPNALCEAMLVGTPSIAMYAGGIPSILAHGEEGLLCQPGDPAVLSAAIDRFFASDVFATRCAAAASLRARQRHAPEAISARTFEIYKHVIAANKASAQACHKSQG
jgi:glycosyltransferase involved in cell wall biosynthesis